MVSRERRDELEVTCGWCLWQSQTGWFQWQSYKWPELIWECIGLTPKARSHRPAHFRAPRPGGGLSPDALPSFLTFHAALRNAWHKTLQPNYQPELIKGIPNCMSDASQECLRVEILKILLFMRKFYMLTFSKSQWEEQSPQTSESTLAVLIRSWCFININFLPASWPGRFFSQVFYSPSLFVLL